MLLMTRSAAGYGPTYMILQLKKQNVLRFFFFSKLKMSHFELEKPPIFHYILSVTDIVGHGFGFEKT